MPAEPEKKRLNISFKPVEKSAVALDGSLFLSDVPLYEPTYPVDQGPTPTAAPAPYENVTAGTGESFAAY